MSSPNRVERTDEQVVRDVLAGDRESFRLLVRRYGDVLHQHWGEPRLRWVVGSHIAQTRWLSGHRVLQRGKLDFMAEVMPFLDRYL